MLVKDMWWSCFRTPTGKWVWKASRPTESESVAAPGRNPSATPTLTGGVVFDLLGNGEPNSFFDVNPQFYPQIGQTLLVQGDMVFDKIRLTPFSVKVVNDPATYALLDAGQYDENWMTEYNGASGFTMPTTSTVDIWKADSLSPIGDRIDLESGFRKVHSSTSSAPIVVGKPLDLNLGTSVSLVPGRYFVVIGFEFSNKTVLVTRFVGQQNGTNHLGGFNHDLPTTCTYEPTPDAYPEGQSYRLEANNSQPAGPFPSTVGFGSHFTVATTKVIECVVRGDYRPASMVWNPGDLDMQFVATAKKPGVAWGTRAALPASAYQGLACDPFDPRLKNVPLPNGVGPEARVAAACLHLEYLAYKDAPTAPVSITFSPGFPAKYSQIARTSIEAGDRLTGHFASPNRSYELVVSNDPDWLCRTGAALTDPRAVGESHRSQNWAQTDQTGCPGTTYSTASWRGMNLGPGADTFFSWQLISPEDWTWISKRTGDTSPLSYYPFWTHEFQHQVQTNLSHGASIDGATGKYQDGPVGWYSEGQAEYLGFMTSELTGARKDIRSFKMAQARAGLTTLGRTAYDLADDTGQQTLFYNAGFLAYEYLLAHYGLATTMNWWSEWNTPECGTRTREPCWWSKSPQIFGMSKDQLISMLNSYVSLQLGSV